MRKFKARLTKTKTNTLRIVNTTQIHDDTKAIRKMTIINLIRIGIRLRSALFADARIAGQLSILKRNAIRPKRDTDYNSIGNWIANMSNM